MGQGELEEAFALIAEHEDEADFVGECSEELVAAAERHLGLAFPPTYRAFLRRLGAGDIFGAEIYGLVGEDLDAPAVPNGVWLTGRRRSEWGLPGSAIVVGDHGEGADVVLVAARCPSGRGVTAPR